MEPNSVERADDQAVCVRLQRPGISNALVAGCMVLTPDGSLPVQYLSPGDRVITRDTGTAILTDVRHSRQHVQAVSILAGTLCNSRSDRDAVLSASQEVLIRDWRARAVFGKSSALVPAHRLVDGEFVRALGEIELILVELIFEVSHILYADGLELASCQPVQTPD